MSNKNKDFIWNTIYSMTNAAISAILLMIINRLGDENAAGMFALCYSVAQMFATIGYFDIRTVQVIDVKHKHTDCDYYTVKIICCLIMLIVGVEYGILKGFRGDKGTILLVLLLVKMVDAYEEYFIGLYQSLGLLSVGTRAASVRMILFIISFALFYISKKSIIFASSMALLISCLFVMFYYIWGCKKKYCIKPKGNLKSIGAIVNECFPLFAGSYLTVYIGNAPKYSIDKFLHAAEQNAFGILFLPSFVINLFSGFCIKPVLVDLSNLCYDNHKEYRKKVRKIVFTVIVISVVVFLGAYLIGIPILELVYKVSLAKFKSVLLLLIIGGAFSALGVILSYLITILQHQKLLLINYACTAICAFAFSDWFVKSMGLPGAGIAYTVYHVINDIIMIVIYCFLMKNERIMD